MKHETDMMMIKQQHEPGNIKRTVTETNNLEAMQKRQHEKGNMNTKEMKEQQHQTRNIKRPKLVEN